MSVRVCVCGEERYAYIHTVHTTMQLDEQQKIFLTSHVTLLIVQ